MVNYNHFQVGGTLGFNNSSYVVRQADNELLSYLLKGDFCFVLNSRQMGKSSLMVKTADKLRAKNISCAFSDLSVLGITEVASEQWYKSFAYQLLDSLDLDEIDLDSWWEKHNSLTSISCLEKFIEKIILTELSNKIVIFIDEIDSVIKLPFKDDFFALIRGFYNKRTINNKYNRLTFCLLGVATPSDLIENKVRTPFNIGYPIKLSGFTLEEAKNALIPGFPDFIEQPENVLKQVLKWTGGQPFLTQKLCLLISQHSNSSTPDVEDIVRKYMINDWESQDYPQHFKTISDRLLYDPNSTIKLLDIYQKILQKKEIIADDSLAQNQLRISGLVNKKENYLKVYNPIYEQIFNLKWIQEQLNNIRPYSIQLKNWLASNCSHEYLLSESELMKALEWAKDKNIASEDHQYLSASREYSIQQKSQKELLKAQQEKKKIITHSKKILLAIITISGIVITGTTLFANNRGYQARISKLERDSNIALQEFEQGEQLKGLSRAIAINAKLKNRTKNNQDIVDYSTVKPIVTINNIINQIEEKNIIKISDDALTNIAYNAEGQLITINKEGIVNVWDSSKQQIIDNLLNEEKVTNLAVSSNGEEIYIANQKKSIITIINRSNSSKKYFNTNNIINSIAVSADGKYIVSGNSLGELMLWTKEGQKINNWSAHKGTINSIALSPNNNLIATAGYDTTVKLWTKEGALINTLSRNDVENSTLINSIAFSPDGKTIATAGNDNTINLWNIDGSHRYALSIHTDAVNSIAFSPDGETIVSASSDNTIKLWNIDGTLKQTIKENKSNINSVAFNPNGKTLASANDQGIVKIWQFSRLQNRIDKGVFINNQKQLLSYSFQGIKIENMEGATVKTISPIKNKLINSLAVNPQQNILIVGTIDGTVALFNLQQSNSWQLLENKYQGKIIDISVHPSGEEFITLGINETDNNQYIIKQWNIDGNLIKTLDTNKEEITAIKYNRQGNIAIATQQGNIELWDEKSNFSKLIVDSNKNDNAQEKITSIAFSPNNKLIATSNEKGEIQLRKVNGELLATFTKNDEQKIVYLEFTADNKTIKVIDQYGKVTDWHLDINTLINKGCSWLEDYLATQNEATELTKICSSQRQTR